MKILYTNFHGGPGIGGHTSYILRLARALAGRGHEIAVAAPAGSALCRLAAGIPGVSVHAQSYPSRLAGIPAARASLRALLRQGGFDIVHVNGSADHRLVMLACPGLPRRPRIVLTKHNDLPIAPLGAWIRARLATDHVIAVCDYVARMVQASPYRRSGVTMVANGIDTGHFSPVPAEQAGPLRAQWAGRAGDGALLLGSNAGTDDYKGWMDLVRAVRRLSEPLRERVRIVVAGAPPRQDLWDEVAACGLAGQVSYAGRLEDVRPMLAALDAGFVLSYRVETISFACREMMAMGKPVIVTRHAGLPENVTDGVDGWIVPPRDPEALAGLLARLLTDGFDLVEMGRRARQKSVREFGLERFVSGTEQVYRQLADSAAPAGRPMAGETGGMRHSR